MNRRRFLQATAASAASLALSRNAFAADNPDLASIQKEIEKRHDESVQRLQQWIRQPSIAAENRGMNEGCDLTMGMLRDAGFGEVTKIPTDGQPGIFATLDAGAPRTIGIYFMYDVKQVDPAEWSSPPFDAALIDKPGLGKADHWPRRSESERSRGLLSCRPARHSGRRPQASRQPGLRCRRRRGNRFTALPAVRATSGGARRPSEMRRRFHSIRRAVSRRQRHDHLGAKGVVELELVSSGEKWGRGPRKMSTPATRLDRQPRMASGAGSQTLVSADGNTPAIEGFADKARPLIAEEKKMIAEAARRLNEKVRSSLSVSTTGFTMSTFRRRWNC